MQQILKQQQSLSHFDSLNSQLITHNSQLSYLNPTKHSIFIKQYKLDVSPPQIHTLAKDMNDYHILLEAEMKKIIQLIKSSHLFSNLTDLIDTFSDYILQFNRRNIEITKKMIRKINNCEQSNFTKPLNVYCDGCSKLFEQQKIEQIREKMKVRKFNDQFNFYNVDHLNFRDMVKMRRQSQNIMDSEFNAIDNRYDITSQCITYEQYEEVLNLLGSDIHAKNISIGKIIEQMNSVEGKIMAGRLSESNKTEKQKEQIKVFQKMSVDQGLHNKIIQMLQKFHTRLYEYKKYRNVDCQTQVIMKENQIIRQLEINIKQFRRKIKHIQSQRNKQYQQYQATIHQKDETISQMNQNGLITAQRMEQLRIQDDQRILQLGQMIDLLRSEQHQQHVKNAYLSTIVNSSKLERSSVGSSRGNIQSLQKRRQSRRQSRKISMIRRPSSNFSSKNENDDQSGQDFNNDNTKQPILRKKPKIRKTINGDRKFSLINQPKTSMGNSSSVKSFDKKLNRYEKIDETNETNEEEERERKKANKMSRFKAIASLISRNKNNSKLNTSEQQIYSSKNIGIPESVTSQNLPSIYENLQQNQTGEQIKEEEEKDLQQQKQSAQLPYKRSKIENESGSATKEQILSKLYEMQSQNGYFSNFKFGMFLQFYQSFIDSIVNLNVGNINDDKRYSTVHQNNSIKEYKQKLSNPKAASLKPNRQQYKSNSLSVHQRDAKNECGMNKKQARNSAKFELLQKHGQFYMHKPKKSIKEQNSNETSPISTLQNIYCPSQLNHEISFQDISKYRDNVNQNLTIPQKPNNKIKIAKPSLFSEEEIIKLFLCKENIFKYHGQIHKIQTTIFNSGQNQFLMNTLAKLAQLHVQNKKDYVQIKTCLYFPEEILKSGDQIQLSEELSANNQLRISLRYLVILHRKCNSQQNKKGIIICPHLGSLLQKIDSYLDKQVKIKQEAKVMIQKKEVKIIKKSKTEKVLR